MITEVAIPATVPKEFLGPPVGFNPTLVMFFAAFAIALLSTWGYFQVHWPGWISFVANMLALHLMGTVIHDASHNVAHSNRIMNAIMGHGSALMLGFVFPVFTRVHIQHHAHVNDPENDPDYYVSKGGPLWLIAPRFFYHEVFFFKRRLLAKIRTSRVASQSSDGAGHCHLCGAEWLFRLCAQLLVFTSGGRGSDAGSVF